jgi:hypothetical protein
VKRWVKLLEHIGFGVWAFSALYVVARFFA